VRAGEKVGASEPGAGQDNRRGGRFDRLAQRVNRKASTMVSIKVLRRARMNFRGWPRIVLTVYLSGSHMYSRGCAEQPFLRRLRPALLYIKKRRVPAPARWIVWVGRSNRDVAQARQLSAEKQLFC